MLVKKRDERVETFRRQKIFHGLERVEKSLYGELSMNRKEVLDNIVDTVLSKIESLAKNRRNRSCGFRVFETRRRNGISESLSCQSN